MEALISIFGSSNGSNLDAESDVLVDFLSLEVLLTVGRGVSMM